MADVVPVRGGAIADVAMTYTDPHRVRQALDIVIRQIMSEDAPRYSRIGAFALDNHSATAAVRVAGVDRGAPTPCARSYAFRSRSIDGLGLQ